jgi:uncharacterized membrane protein YqhA
VRYFLPLRFLMLIACLGALLGAILMFGLAGAKLAHGVEAFWLSGFGQAGEVSAAVMGSTDAFLFGVVLIIFAFAIAFGFVFHVGGARRESIPDWMQIDSVSELKHILVEVIIVYLVVDFATDLATGGDALAWLTLVKPIAIVLLASALRLMGQSPQGDEHAGNPGSNSPN